jgi:hypothetical protein
MKFYIPAEYDVFLSFKPVYTETGVISTMGKLRFRAKLI